MLSFYALLTIGTNLYGSFGLYTLETIGGLAPATALAVSLIGVPIILLTVIAIMRPMDSAARRPLFIAGAIVQVLAWASLLVLPQGPLSLVIAFVVYGVGTTLAGEPHYKVWSQEIFPTAVRSSALGLSFGTGRIISAISLVFVPTLLHTGLVGITILMIMVTTASGVLGVTFMPRRHGESIAAIDSRSGIPSK
jgi:inositol transporter-like SP family MFS transporter